MGHAHALLPGDDSDCHRVLTGTRCLRQLRQRPCFAMPCIDMSPTSTAFSCWRSAISAGPATTASR